MFVMALCITYDYFNLSKTRLDEFWLLIESTMKQNSNQVVLGIYINGHYGCSFFYFKNHLLFEYTWLCYCIFCVIDIKEHFQG